MEPNEVSAQMVEAACKIHIELGPSLRETMQMQVSSLFVRFVFHNRFGALLQLPMCSRLAGLSHESFRVVGVFRG
jgi:hypothetical protein